jgi:antirestriction protein ArdC
VGISNNTVDNSAAYIQAWLKKLNDDKKMIIQAASKAQKAINYILGTKEEQTIEAEKEEIENE